jgi:hypothetical protein
MHAQSGARPCNDSDKDIGKVELVVKALNYHMMASLAVSGGPLVER